MQLRVLDVSTNKLDKFPEEILGLVKLTQLKISGNRLEEMPSLTVLVRLKSVRATCVCVRLHLACPDERQHACPPPLPPPQLDVSGNALATLPAIPASLRTLVASHNRLAEFPRHALTPALDTLDLAGNAIHALRDEDLAGADGAASADAPLALTTLHLDDNGLSELPSSWAPVARLAVLTLRRNDLQYVQLTESLFTATELWNLRVEGNSRGQWTQSLLQELPGFADFEARRLRKANKAMHGGVDVDRTLCGLSG